MFEHRYWTSRDGLRLHYRDYPGRADRPSLLCLHGLTRNARDFEDFAARLAGEWRVIVPDFRGRGMSDHDPQPENYSPPVYAGDILQLLDELALDPAVLVGTSLGGLVTMAIATVAPKRIAAAVLNDVGPELDPRGIERISDYVGQPGHFATWDDAADAVAATHGDRHPGYTPADWLRMTRRLCREAEGYVDYDYDMRIADNFRVTQATPPGDAWPYFRALAGVPLLILRGEHSDLLSPAAAQAMADAHPGAELITVPGVGHPPDLGEPEALATIDRFLRSLRPR